jgi:hypothetical protein
MTYTGGERGVMRSTQTRFNGYRSLQRLRLQRMLLAAGTTLIAVAIDFRRSPGSS